MTKNRWGHLENNTREESYRDDPRDQASIEAGYKLFERFKQSGELTAADVAACLCDVELKTK